MRPLIKAIVAVAATGVLAAIVVPNYVKSRTTRSLNSCVDVNQPALTAAKQRWVSARHPAAGTTPTQGDLLPFLEDPRWPVCPAGGTYELGPVGTPPACSLRQEHPSRGW